MNDIKEILKKLSLKEKIILTLEKKYYTKELCDKIDSELHNFLNGKIDEELINQTFDKNIITLGQTFVQDLNPLANTKSVYAKLNQPVLQRTQANIILGLDKFYNNATTYTLNMLENKEVVTPELLDDACLIRLKELEEIINSPLYKSFEVFKQKVLDSSYVVLKNEGNILPLKGSDKVFINKADIRINKLANLLSKNDKRIILLPTDEQNENIVILYYEGSSDDVQDIEYYKEKNYKIIIVTNSLDGDILNQVDSIIYNKEIEFNSLYNLIVGNTNQSGRLTKDISSYKAGSGIDIYNISCLNALISKGLIQALFKNDSNQKAKGTLIISNEENKILQIENITLDSFGSNIFTFNVTANANCNVKLGSNINNMSFKSSISNEEKPTYEFDYTKYLPTSKKTQAIEEQKKEKTIESQTTESSKLNEMPIEEEPVEKVKSSIIQDEVKSAEDVKPFETEKSNPVEVEDAKPLETEDESPIEVESEEVQENAPIETSDKEELKSTNLAQLTEEVNIEDTKSFMAEENEESEQLNENEENLETLEVKSEQIKDGDANLVQDFSEESQVENSADNIINENTNNIDENNIDIESDKQIDDINIEENNINLELDEQASDINVEENDKDLENYTDFKCNIPSEKVGFLSVRAKIMLGGLLDIYFVAVVGFLVCLYNSYYVNAYKPYIIKCIFLVVFIQILYIIFIILTLRKQKITIEAVNESILVSNIESGNQLDVQENLIDEENIDNNENKVNVVNQKYKVNIPKSFDGTTQICQITNALQEFFKSRGLEIDYNCANSVISSVISSRLIIIRNEDKELLDKILITLKEFFGLNDSLLDSESSYDIDNLIDYSSDMFTEIYSNRGKVNLVTLINSPYELVDSICTKLKRYINNPLTNTKYQNSKVNIALPNNVWFIIKEDENKLITENIYKNSIVLNIDVSVCEEDDSYTILPINFELLMQISAYINKHDLVPYTIWESLDELEEELSNINYKIDASLDKLIERYLNCYLNNEGDINSAMDNLVCSIIIPYLLDLNDSLELNSILNKVFMNYDTTKINKLLNNN